MISFNLSWSTKMDWQKYCTILYLLPKRLNWYYNLSLFVYLSSNSAICQPYHEQNKLIINEMMLRSALYKTYTLGWIFIVPAHWKNSLWIDMSPHSDKLFWFWANQSLLFLLSATYRKSNKYQFHCLWFDPIGLEHTIYRTLGGSR